MRDSRFAYAMARAVLLCSLCSLPWGGMACGPTAWEQARQQDTLVAYRAFQTAHPGDPKAAQAREREIELAYEALGESPKRNELEDFLKRYPKSSYAPGVERRLERVRLDGLLGENDIGGLELFAKRSQDAALVAKANDALGYLRGARNPLNRAHFEGYLRQNPSGPYADRAKRRLAWLERVKAPRQSKILAEIEGDLHPSIPERIWMAFRIRGIEVEFVKKTLGIEQLRDGEIAYRFINVQPGRDIRVFSGRGTVQTVTPEFSGIAAQLLRRRREHLEVIWSDLNFDGTVVAKNPRRLRYGRSRAWNLRRAGAAKVDRSLSDVIYPILSRDNAPAVIGGLEHDAIITQLASFGDYLVAATADGVSFVDTSLPQAPRVAARFPPEGESLFAGRRVVDISPHISVRPPVVGVTGNGLTLINARNLSALDRIEVRGGKALSRLYGGAFFGEWLYLLGDRKTWVTGVDGKAPRPVTAQPGNYILRWGKRLVVVSERGVNTYRVRRSGELVADFEKRWKAGGRGEVTLPRVSSATVSDHGVFMVHENGVVSLLDEEGPRVAPLELEHTGLIRAVAARGSQLITAGDWGLTLLERKERRFEATQTALVPGGVTCQDVEWRGDIIWAACNQLLLSVHVDGLRVAKAKN